MFCLSDMKKLKVIAIGEIVWDMLPSGKHPSALLFS